MHLFQIFKKKNARQVSTPESNIAIAVCQHEVKVQEDLQRTDCSIPVANPVDDSQKSKHTNYLSKRDEEIQRLNEAFDFKSIEGIRSIPVPCIEVNGDSYTGRVEYYLRGRCFAEHWNNGDVDLAIECLKKAQDLMLISDMIWDMDAFMRICYYLRKAGRYEEAAAEEEKIKRFFKTKNSLRDNVEQQIQSARFLKTNLMEVYCSGVCCSECAKFKDRIYSISGKDPRFPKLPKMFIPKTFSYDHNCLSFSPFVLGVNEPDFCCNDTIKIIEHSNRPFIDDRTEEEIQRYQNWEQEQKDEQEKKKQMQMEEEEDFLRVEKRRKEFAWLQDNLPALCPKSLAGYSRMKNANSAAYQKIVKAAYEMGMDLASK